MADGIKIRTNLDKLFENKLRKIEVLTRRLSEKWIFFIQNHFDKEGDPRWHPLAPRTLRERQRKGYTGKILQRTNILRNSNQPFYDDRKAGVINMSPYSRAHELGAIIDMPARSRLYTQNRYKQGSKKGKFKKGTQPGQGATSKAYKIIIPQRSFMALSDSEKDIFSEMIVEFIEE